MTAADGTQLARNLRLFCRGLRAAGLPVDSRQQADALLALRAVGFARRDDTRAALRAVVVRRHGQLQTFEQAFNLLFDDPGALAKLPEAAASEAPATAAKSGNPAGDGLPSASRYERLRHKDFADMSATEQRLAAGLLRRELALPRPLPRRRLQTAASGPGYDRRRMLRRLLANGGELAALPRRSPVRVRPALVVLCDISGSMSDYARAFLQFAHGYRRRGVTVHAFVFGTRLSNVSRPLAERDFDAVLNRITLRVRDFDGGTRIGAALGEFNRRWGRRLLARPAHVLLYSDGLERDPGSSLAAEAARLRRSCRRFYWLTPLTRYAGFRPEAAGMRALLPQVDALLPGHDAASLLACAARLAGEPAA